MTGAMHGWWCNARTYPLNCKYCGERIFHFSCDCGSSVLFDELGPPWPIHRCPGFELKLTLSRLGQGDLSGTLLSYLDEGKAEALSRLIEDNIERGYVDAIRHSAKEQKKPSSQSGWIMRQDPYHGLRTTEQGVIKELIWGADIFKKANIPIGSLGSTILGKFAKQKLAQITIHTAALAEEESENCSFTFFVAEKIVNKLALTKGCLITVELRGVAPLPNFPVWVCDDLVDLN